MKKYLKQIINSELNLQENLAGLIGFLHRDLENNKELLSYFREMNFDSKERLFQYEQMLANYESNNKINN
jgi:hypothetical protein